MQNIEYVEWTDELVAKWQIRWNETTLAIRKSLNKNEQILLREMQDYFFDGQTLPYNETVIFLKSFTDVNMRQRLIYSVHRFMNTLEGHLANNDIDRFSHVDVRSYMDSFTSIFCPEAKEEFEESQIKLQTDWEQRFTRFIEEIRNQIDDFEESILYGMFFTYLQERHFFSYPVEYFIGDFANFIAKKNRANFFAGLRCFVSELKKETVLIDEKLPANEWTNTDIIVDGSHYFCDCEESLCIELFETLCEKTSESRNYVA